MKRLWFLIAGVLVAALVAWLVWPAEEAVPIAPDAPGSVPERSPQPSQQRLTGGRVSGRVVRDGQPVAKARVSLRSTGSLVAWTLDDGAFLFDDVPAGAFFVSAVTDEAASEVLGPLQLAAGGNVGDLVLSLAPALKIEGVVVDLLTRKPIAGAAVVSAAKALQTDATGRFVLAGPKTQTWIDVSAPGFLSRTEWVSLELASTGSRLELVLTPVSRLEGRVTEGGTPVAAATVWGEYAEGARRGERTLTVFTDREGRFIVESAAGALRLAAVTPRGTRVKGPFVRVAVGEKKVGLALEAGEATYVEGVVTRDGAPLAGAQLTAVDALSEEVVAFSTTGPDGRFRFESLLDGRYVAQVRKGGFSALAGPFEQNGDGRQWTIALTGGASLEGRVEPASAGVRVRCRAGNWSGPSAEAVTDERGVFRFEGLPAELVSLDAEGPAGAATARARPGDQVVLRLQRGQVVVHLQDDSGGVVSDGVLLARSIETGAVRRQLVLAPDGVTRLDLPAGPWELSLEVQGRGRSAPARIDVTAAGADVRLSLEASLTISGTVKDAATQLPIDGAQIEAFSGEWGRGYRVAVVSDARGQFVLPPVPRSATIVVRRDGYQRQWRRAIDGARWDVAMVRAAPDAPPQPSDSTQFEGVGMVLDARSGPVLVSQVNEGGPAERAGVQKGDVVLAVDGMLTAGLPLDQVVARIRGPAGTLVRIKFQRGGQEFELTIRRRQLTL